MLNKGDVHIWRWILPSSEDQSCNEKILSQDEKLRADGFYFAKDRFAYVASHIVLRRLLSRYLNIEPLEICFDYNAYGKPSVISLQNPQTVFFNMSHSHECVLYAFTLNQEIGVDVEYLKENIDYEGIAKRFFADNEYQALKQVNEVHKSQLFYRIWTCKEAFIKANGSGLSYPLADFEVCANLSQPAKLLHIKQAPEEVNQWSLFSLDLGEEYMGAVAVKRDLVIEHTQIALSMRIFNALF